MQWLPPRAVAAVACLIVTMATADAASPIQAGPIVSHIRRAPVTSSVLAAVGYSRKLHALEIEFRNGAIYRYLNVPRTVHESLLEAPSKARFYDQNIRRKYKSLHVRRRNG